MYFGMTIVKKLYVGANELEDEGALLLTESLKIQKLSIWI